MLSFYLTIEEIVLVSFLKHVWIDCYVYALMFKISIEFYYNSTDANLELQTIKVRMNKKKWGGKFTCESCHGQVRSLNKVAQRLLLT